MTATVVDIKTRKPRKAAPTPEPVLTPEQALAEAWEKARPAFAGD